MTAHKKLVGFLIHSFHARAKKGAMGTYWGDEALLRMNVPSAPSDGSLVPGGP